MSNIDAISSVLSKYLYWMVPTSITVIDVIEIIIIAFLLYEFMAWVKRTRAWVLFKGILLIIIFVAIAAVFQMNTILWLAEKLVSVGIIAVIVVFQPELRNALEHLGRRHFFKGLFSIGAADQLARERAEKMADEIISAAVEMGKAKTGALIVFEHDVPLDEYVRTGIEIDALVSRQLLINIFEHNTPLHDGAVIVREWRIVAGTCYLPLSDNSSISKEFGTRHRAAVGISEVSDSLTIVVSEETGKISYAREGKLSVGVTPDKLKNTMVAFATDNMEDRRGLKNIAVRRKKDVQEDR